MSSLSADTSWAVHEFAEAELGDLRRTKRLIELATVLAQNPRASLPEASGNSAMLKAAYRFFANEAIAPQDIVHSHIEATYGRLDTVPVVLAVQDTTEVNWTSLRATTGLGPLGDIQRAGACLSIVPWRSRLSVCPWGCWRNRSGHGMPTMWANAPGASSCPSPRKKVKSGSGAWKLSAMPTRVVLRRALSA